MDFKSTKIKRLILWPAIALMFLAGVSLYQYFNVRKLNYLSGLAQIKQTEIKIAYADNPLAWYRGLSRQKSLCSDCGLLFVFPEAAPRTFVMRDMNFPLDIVFIKDGIILNSFENLWPEGGRNLQAYRSQGEVDMVLELNGGYLKRHNLKAGDQVAIRKF